MTSLLDDRTCVICRSPFDGGTEGHRVVHCCRTCGHASSKHSEGRLVCSVCHNECGIDCRPTWMRRDDGWPVRLSREQKAATT